MKNRTHDSHQLNLLDVGLGSPHMLGDNSSMCVQPNLRPARREPRGQRNRRFLDPIHAPAPPPHRAPRGDLFREAAEKTWAAPENTKQTPEDVRAKAYWRLADS